MNAAWTLRNGSTDYWEVVRCMDAHAGRRDSWWRQDVARRRAALYHEAKVTQAMSLADLAEEYVFFTHAVLFCFADFDRDPVFDYVTEYDPSCQPFHVDFPDALFAGLVHNDSLGWNHRLLLVPRSHWAGLDWFLERPVRDRP